MSVDGATCKVRLTVRAVSRAQGEGGGGGGGGGAYYLCDRVAQGLRIVFIELGVRRMEALVRRERLPSVVRSNLKAWQVFREFRRLGELAEEGFNVVLRHRVVIRPPRPSLSSRVRSRTLSSPSGSLPLPPPSSARRASEPSERPPAARP